MSGWSKYVSIRSKLEWVMNSMFHVADLIDLTFTAEPEDALVSRNASLVLDCGVPAGWLLIDTSPVVEWKKDGILLNLLGETRRYTLRELLAIEDSKPVRRARSSAFLTSSHTPVYRTFPRTVSEPFWNKYFQIECILLLCVCVFCKILNLAEIIWETFIWILYGALKLRVRPPGAVLGFSTSACTTVYRAFPKTVSSEVLFSFKLSNFQMDSLNCSEVTETEFQSQMMSLV